MAGLDMRIVLVGLPTIGRQLGIGIDELVWTTQAYVFTSTLFALLVGRVGDQFGRVKLYNVGFVVFTIGSALASLSTTGIQLIAFRAIQGVGAALLMVNSQAMLADAAEGSDLGTMLGINMIAGSIGGVAGLTLSGIILTFADWRALFYINVPVGIFGTLWARSRLHEITEKDTSKQVDWPGLIAFSVGLLLILLSLTYLSYGPSGTRVGLALLFCGCASLSGFIWIESKSPAPLLDLGLFRNRVFAAGNLSMIISCIPFFGQNILVSLYLQLGLGMSPLETGLVYVPLTVAAVLGGPFWGRLTDRYGGRRLVATGGLGVYSLGQLLLATSGTQDPLVIAGYLAICGFGTGMYITPNTSAVMLSVKASQRGVASGFRATIGNLFNSASYGFVVLLLTIAIPYGTLTGLLQNSALQTSPAVLGQFLFGSKIAFYTMAAMNAAAMIPCAMMKPKRPALPATAETAPEPVSAGAAGFPS